MKLGWVVVSCAKGWIIENCTLLLTFLACLKASPLGWNMTTARKYQVCADATPYYHCVSRCVRRSFLCGTDPITHQSYEHRRSWIKRKMMALSQVYCIDICAYAIMSNHYHLVVHINREKAESLSNRQVVERWQHDHKLPFLVSHLLRGHTL